MGVYNSKTWMDDLVRVVEANPWLVKLTGQSVMITGIGGLVCSPIADVLICHNEMHNNNPITIIAAARSEAKVRERFGKYYDRNYFHFVKYDANSSVFNTDLHIDYIIHGAGNSSPDMITKEPVETMLSNFNGLYELLNFARWHQVKRVLYISSSEVYGLKDGDKPYVEDQYGYIDLLKARNSYSVGKRAAETLCVSFAEEYGIDSVIIRPGHIYGPTAGINDRHISSQWSYDAAYGRNIVMKSDGEQLRSYCYCLDCATAILTVLIKGNICKAYNISNPNSVINIKQMAEILSSCAGVQIQMELPSDTEKRSFNPMKTSSLDSVNILNLGWNGLFNADEGFAHTVQIIKEMQC